MKPNFNLKDASLLVVDDQPDNLRLVADFLEEYGADVMLGHDGADGLAKARLGHPDLILLDVMMPDMDGFEVCRRLKQDAETRDIPVIFLTALHEVEDKLKGFQAGGVDYLTKPLQELEVIARVDVHLKLRQALLQAEAANQAKNRFLANMNHEIRTPINAVLGYAALLEDSDQQPQQRRHLAPIRKAGSILLHLIDSILDLSRLDSGRVRMEPVPTRVSEILQDVESLFTAEALQKGLSLKLDCTPVQPRPLMLDDLRLRQVLINLVGNALKFTRKGGVEVLANCRALDPRHMALEITVRDSGIGIPEQEQERIFEAFTQRQGQRHADFGGSGLGLSISRHLAELMGGTLAVSSKPGEGSSFFLNLPKLEIAADAPITPVSEQEARKFAPFRVLVADDDASSRLLLVEFLTRAGLQVTTAEDGEQAVQAARTQAPDLILIDLNMPVLQGDEAACMLAREPKTSGIPIIVVSATDKDQVYPEIKGCIADYLAKPFTREGLLDILAPHLPSRPADGDEPVSERPDTQNATPLSLKGSESDYWRAIPEHPSVNEVEELARILAQSGDGAVRNMGERLMKAAMEFDSVAINTLFEELKRRVGSGETKRG